jgi:hypothetical protein
VGFFGATSVSGYLIPDPCYLIPESGLRKSCSTVLSMCYAYRARASYFFSPSYFLKEKHMGVKTYIYIKDGLLFTEGFEGWPA